MVSFQHGSVGLEIVVISFLLYCTDKREEQLYREIDCLCHLQEFSEQ